MKSLAKLANLEQTTIKFALRMGFVSAAFIAFGTFFIITGTVGILRFPTFFTRVHAVGVSDSLGAPLFLIGCAIEIFSFLDAFKIVLLISSIWITSGTATYAVCKAKFLELGRDNNN